MSTYAGSADVWLRMFHQAVTQIPSSKLGIGLEMVNPNNNQPLTDAELDLRFTHIIAAKIEQVDIWRSPLGENWWPFLEKYVNSA